MGKSVVVADAGPLLHLNWIGVSEWALPRGEIAVVESVWQEVERYDPTALADARLRRMADPTPIPHDLAERTLGPGETAALAYALDARCSAEVQVLTDDRRARRACDDLGLSYTGSVGLILEAYKAGAVSADVAEGALRALSGPGGLWLSAGVMQAALQTVRETHVVDSAPPEGRTP